MSLVENSKKITRHERKLRYPIGAFGRFYPFAPRTLQQRTHLAAPASYSRKRNDARRGRDLRSVRPRSIPGRYLPSDWSCYNDFTAKAPTFSTYVCDLKTYCTQTIRIRLHALTEDTYRYLQALNCLEDDDYDNALMEPVSLPCNVQGGIGFVSVSTPYEISLTLPERRCKRE